MRVRVLGKNRVCIVVLLFFLNVNTQRCEATAKMEREKINKKRTRKRSLRHLKVNAQKSILDFVSIRMPRSHTNTRT